MRICDFAYHRPQSVAEACELARELGDRALFLAGGTELIPDFKRGSDDAQHLISLRDIPGLAEIRDSGEYLVIGSMTRLDAIASSAAVRSAFPVLAEAAAQVGGVQIRHQATIGGNFCRAVPCADTPPPCIAGEARVRVSGSKGDRLMPAEEFFTGPRKNALGHGEILLEVLIPRQPARAGSSYQRFSLRRGSSLAVAAVAARVVLDGDTVDSARIALGAVAPVPLLATRAARALAGRPLSDETIAEAARTAAEEAQPITDLRGSEEYRRQLVEVLTARALVAAAERARGQG
jgi:carbon-monoxide dehydrogenase medium subunit